MAALQSRVDLPMEVISPFYETSSTTSHAALVKSGLAIAVLPTLIAHHTLTTGLSFSLLHQPILHRTLSLIFHQDHPLSPVAAGLVAEIRHHVQLLPLPKGCRAL